MAVQAVISAISTGVQLLSKANKQQEQNEKARRQHKANVESIYEGTNLDLDLIEMQQRQIEEASNERIYQRRLQALRDRSRISVVAGEAGVGGNTIDRLVNFYEMDEASDVQAMERNKEMKLGQSAMQAKERIRQAESNINRSAQQKESQTTESPYGKAILRGAPSVAMSYLNYQASN